MTEYDAIIVGAGLAGLSCGYELTKEKQRVLILEAEPYLGGRTASWEERGMKIESALHRFLGFYSALPDLITACGGDLDKIITWEDQIEIVTPDGAQAVFGASPLGRPLETIASALGNTNFLSTDEKAQFVKFVTVGLADYYTKPEELDQRSVIDYAKDLEISQTVIDRVLRPFTEGLLFHPLEQFSMLAMMAFLGPYLHKSIRFGVGAFTGGMSEVMIQPIAETIKRQGGEIQTGSPVESLVIADDTVVGVNVNGEIRRAKHVILATAVGTTQKIVRDAFPDHEWVKKLTKLPTLSVISLQIELPAPAWLIDRVIFAPRTLLSSFAEQSRTTFRGSAGRLSIDVAPASHLINESDEQIFERVAADAEKIGLNLRQALEYRVVRHINEFYEPSPGSNQLRPSQQTPIPGLILAGDYTEQPCPSNMEGAVISGQRAANVFLTL